MTQAVPEKINFPEEEEKILALWKKINAFQTCLKQSKGKPNFTFFDGPPFATGLPHYGHVLAGTVKDIITRWAHQSGFHVERRFGWDCHGLPVEHEIDKTLGITGPEDVMKMGIKNYNDECRKIVMRYSKEWVEIMTRLARWIDFDKDYKTMYPTFMESIWFVFKQLYEKGLVYKGVKVMPFSTSCNTPLSNFEAGLNYKDVCDPAIVVSFPLVDKKGVSMIAWTTTPWTLPSNLSLCVNPDMIYVTVLDKVRKEKFIIMKTRLCELFKEESEYEILEETLGKKLEGLKYVPMFDYFKDQEAKGAFKVLCDRYVTDTSGTGIVQQAPYFGEDDYQVNLRYGIIDKDQEPICPVDDSGKFTAAVSDFKGMYVKDADKGILKMIKDKKRLVKMSQIKHSYPFCWRSDTPLLYKGVNSWFVRVEHARQALLDSNEKTYWVPDFVKEKRFGNWLRDAKDWNISRNRFWGNPIPLWISDDGEEVVCVGSIKELEELTGQKITDIHRENIDHLTIPSNRGKGVLRRISQVFDCWFESGSMPYGQCHYPFENKKDFEENFPADFISEGIDQTRGWFYTLMVLSTSLFGKPPFKNLVCTGMVLAEDGKKMSKRLKNYPDPVEVVNKYGADAIRLYLVNSPVVRAEQLKFKEKGVRDILKDVFLPWYNAYRFLIQNIQIYESEEGKEFKFDEKAELNVTNYMDKWIVSFIQSLVKQVQQEMKDYRLYTVVPALLKFIDQLTNWYVRMNRKRLKGDSTSEDCQQALTTLYSVLFTIVRLLAPFVPYLTELMYQTLKNYLAEVDVKESVHYLMLPVYQQSLINVEIENAVADMQSVIEAGRLIRDQNNLPSKYPLSEVVVIHKEKTALENVLYLESHIKEELNVRKLTISQDKAKYDVTLKATLDFKVVGSRLKSDMQKVKKMVDELPEKDLEKFQETGEITLHGHVINRHEMKLTYVPKSSADEKGSNLKATSWNKFLVLLDTVPSKELVDEGLAREIINRVQKLRKAASLLPTDEINIYYKTTDKIEKVAKDFKDFIWATVKQTMIQGEAPDSANVIIEEETAIKENSLKLVITSPASSVPAPFCKFVNVTYADGRKGTILLENPIKEHQLEYNEFEKQVKLIFGIRSVEIFLDSTKKTKLERDVNLLGLKGRTVYAF
ncbi:DgyrCDS11658 [Dimorphilus gyrociliatus]|uniref:Isoleucine--tRNA ligase, cytoplasmic n=1 Tax=Dimorphilus gyrociliatus TaxID=2664684 RepID=A0A7I8W4Y7_9ANNE|nr:DgyrCDS11658 [Dimorphilus gyrociliatus]